jgi:CHASE2 domain-containing sensor protein
LTGLVVSIFIAILYGCGLFDRWECLIYDMKLRLRGKLVPDKRIVIVAVDEQSLNELGK